MTDEQYMQQALVLAKQAADEGEVPVGAIVVRTSDGTVVGRGRNRRECAKHALSHAEIEAIDQACKTLGGWRLSGCTLYVTLEPCPMCAGAIINARLDRVVYGTCDPKAGSCGSLVNVFELPYNHRPVCESGVCETACADILRSFFKSLRQAKKQKQQTEEHVMQDQVKRLNTEQNNPATVTIDTVDTLTALHMIHREDQLAVEAMQAALPALATMADEIAARLQNGGRLFYAGAGTSGRVAVLDASELPATYGVSPSLVKALVPGGYDTLPDARLGDEDDREGARTDLAAEGLCEKDAVIGITASGRTPYAHEALLFAKEQGAFAGAIVNVPHSVLETAADVTAVIDTGAEAIQGSTRMKAGTTQKLALNMLSTAVMIRLGKVYRNKMVEITAINEKMVIRCEQMLVELTGTDEQTAARVLKECDYHVKTAAAAILCGCDATAAREILEKHNGKLGEIL